MLIVFFDIEGIVRAEFVPRGTTVNSEYYKGLLERLRNDVRRKGPEKLKNGFLLRHDNAPCHTPLVIRQFLADKRITVCLLPPYSPDLAPCDLWLIQKIKFTMEESRFDTIPEIEAATKERLRALTKDDSQSGFRSWQGRWNKFIHVDSKGGDYIEGD
jgi:transposase